METQKHHSIYCFKKMFQDVLIERADLDAVAGFYYFIGWSADEEFSVMHA